MALLGPPREHCVTPARAAAKETTWSLDIGETLCLVSVFHQGCSYNSGGLLSRRLYIYSFYVQNLRGGNETAINAKSRITIAKITCCFLFVPITPNYDFRNAKKKLLLQKPRTDYLKRSFSYSGVILWNNLPEEIRTSNSLGFFKRSSHRWFSDQYSHTANT